MCRAPPDQVAEDPERRVRADLSRGSGSSHWETLFPRLNVVINTLDLAQVYL
jgi:hypothetical protein